MKTREPGTFLGHPIGLFVLFFTEMWERFSYYGMRALLILYMVNVFKWTQEEGSGIYKWYTALVYLTPLIGGFIADRYIGNKWAIIIGAISMAIGHFCMAYDRLEIFYAALIFLIIGNGFFKPNMSTQVGRLYPQNDPRRDGAYTIFYMGINIGAFLSPLLCGALRSSLGFHWGFGAAGVGMVISLLTYLFGLRWVKELPPGLVYEGPVDTSKHKKHHEEERPLTEEEATVAPSVTPSLNELASKLVLALGVCLLIAGPLLWQFNYVKKSDAVMIEIAAITAFFSSWVLSQVRSAIRDRVLAIYAVFIFVVFFWTAFEQAGNAMNVWADQTTNRYLTETPKEPELYPSPPEEVTKEGETATIKKVFADLGSINPVLTESFQSINAAAIVLLAPIFAWLWTFLARRRINISIPLKMAFGVFMQGVAFALMVWSVKYENQPSVTKLTQLPSNFVSKDNKLHFYDAPDLNLKSREPLERFVSGKNHTTEKPMISHGGRLFSDASKGTLNMRGVLNNNHRDRMLRSTVSPAYAQVIWDLALESQRVGAEAKAKDGKLTIEKSFDVPAGFEPRYLNGFKPDEVRFDKDSKKLIIGMPLADKDYKQILLAGSEPSFRNALNDLYVQSTHFRVSTWWLVWFYVLCTIGELCLSPVGLSMVSKLAPRKFATMLMGVWLLASTFGNFMAGFLGEKWEYYQPGTYFLTITLAMIGAGIVCFLFARKITAMMHGVK